MGSILGLMSTEQLREAGVFGQTARRSVFYRYPTGKFPLMGLLSLMDTEDVDNTTFGWHEDRVVAVQSETAAANAVGPFLAIDKVTSKADGFNLAAGDLFAVQLVSAVNVRERDVLWIAAVPNAADSAKLQIKVIVVDIDHTNHVAVVRAQEAITSVSNTADAVGLKVILMGSATGEGNRSRTGSYTLPIEISNYTQIFRTAFSFTRSALKTKLKFDKTGAYKGKSKQNALRHMSMLEMSALFGVRRTDVVLSDDGEAVPEKKFGGLEWFLRQYELGNAGNGGAFDYRPNGASAVGTNWTTNEDKRIIDVDGTMSVDEFELFVERALLFNGENSPEKVVMCGNGFMSRFQKVVQLKSLVTRPLNPDKESYGMTMTRWESPWGNLLFKTHPLFNELAPLKNSAFVIDVGSLKYHPLEDSDTELLKNRQPRDYDGRKDEWLTECGIELNFPERFTMINNVTGITV